MLRKMVCAGFVVAVTFSLAAAEEFNASIRKVDGNKITFVKGQKKDVKGEEATMEAAADVKVLTAKFNKEEKKVEAGEALPGGLKNERFKNIGEKGIGARIITDADNKKIVEIRVFGG